MKTYESYKESGVDWIGSIPRDWMNVRLKLISQITKGRKPRIDFEDFEEGLLPYMSMEFLRGKTSSPTYADASEKNLILIDEGDILILWDGSKAGEIVRAKKGILSSTMAKIQINDNRFERNYLNYLLQLGQEHIQNNTVGMGIPHVSGNVLKDLMMLLPSLEEQTQIANYLDHKTHIINALIEKKEQLIKKLQAQRQAIINEAVTKGLNPNAKMKDSGIEWLGDIPEHWEVNLFKRGIKELTDYEANGSFSSVKANVRFSEELKEEYAWYVRATDLEKKSFLNRDNIRWVDENTYNFLSRTELKGGELLIAKRGEIGKVYLMPKFNKPATLAPNLYLLRLNNKILPEFGLFYFVSDIGNTELVLKNRSVTIGAVYKDDLKEINFIYPPLEEQITIVESLKSRTNEIDSILRKIKKQIKKLKVYRQSIISETVTGKMDVRDWQAPNKN